MFLTRHSARLLLGLPREVMNINTATSKRVVREESGGLAIVSCLSERWPVSLDELISHHLKYTVSCAMMSAKDHCRLGDFFFFRCSISTRISGGTSLSLCSRSLWNVALFMYQIPGGKSLSLCSRSLVERRPLHIADPSCSVSFFATCLVDSRLVFQSPNLTSPICLQCPVPTFYLVGPSPQLPGTTPPSLFSPNNCNP